MSVSDDNLVEFVKFSWSASELSESGEEVEEEMEIMASRATPSTCRWAALILIVRGSLLGDSSVVVNQSDILKRLQGGLMPTGGFQEVGGNRECGLWSGRSGKAPY